MRRRVKERFAFAYAFIIMEGLVSDVIPLGTMWAVLAALSIFPPILYIAHPTVRIEYVSPWGWSIGWGGYKLPAAIRKGEA